VLNNADYLYRAKAKGMEDESDELDTESIALVNDLLVRGNAAVVISSSWRYGRLRTQLCDILSKRGFTGTVVGMTPTSRDVAERGHEIQQWLDETQYEIESFAILDDDADMAHLLPRLVKTTFTNGLLPEHIERALTILKEPYVQLPRVLV
jgi:hypothetical protein